MTHPGTRTSLRCVAILVAALTLGCSGSGAPPDAGRADAAATDAAGEAIRFVMDDGGPLVFLADGDAVDLIWGLQGGVMITPSLALPGRTTGEVIVELENWRLPAGVRLEDFPGYGPTTMPTSVRDGVVVTAPIYDQLGWAALPDGTELEVRARVVRAGVTYRGAVRVVLRATPCPAGSCACPGAPDECFGPPDGGPLDVDGGTADDAGLAIDGGVGSPDAGLASDGGAGSPDAGS